MSKRIALVGMPNTGKSTLFNRLTGAGARVGNWPGLTVELLSAKVLLGDAMLELVDLPGLHNLHGFSEDERVARRSYFQELFRLQGELVDVQVPALAARTVSRPTVSLALSEVRRILGATVDPEGITAATVETVLSALGCKLEEANSNAPAWRVTLPSWRLDVEREIDLIEEVARVYGYNRFANTLPAFGEGVKALPWAEAELTVRRALLAAGFHEAISSTFCSGAEAALTAPQPGLVVPLGNPLSEEAGVLRPSLVPGMLSMIAGNLSRDVDDVRLFELGTVFSGSTEKVEERPSLAFALAGEQPEQSALHPGRAADFYDLKGVVEQLLGRFQARSVYFDTFPAEAGLTPAWLHPYRAARIVVEGLTVGWFGQLHPREAAARKLRPAVVASTLSWSRPPSRPRTEPSKRTNSGTSTRPWSRRSAAPGRACEASCFCTARTLYWLPESERVEVTHVAGILGYRGRAAGVPRRGSRATGAPLRGGAACRCGQRRRVRRA